MAHGASARPVDTVAGPAAASSVAAPQTTDAPPPGASAGVARDLTLKQMGANGAIKLHGQDPNGILNVAVRNDEVVTGARLRLVYTYSPSLIYSLSHLKVFLNGEVVATLPMDKEQAGQTVTKELVLDPRLFTDFNRIGVQMISGSASAKWPWLMRISAMLTAATVAWTSLPARRQAARPRS